MSELASEESAAEGGRRVRIRLRPTREGAVVGLVLLGFLAGALNTGTNLLYFVTALFMALLVVNVVVARLALRGLTVRRRAPDRVTVARPYPVELMLSSRSGGGLPLSVLELSSDSMQEAPSAAVFLGLPRGTPVPAGLSARSVQRGLFRSPGVAVSCRAPFGLFEAALEELDPWRLRVVPEPRLLRPRVLAEADGESEGLARRPVFGEERRDTIRGLRDLRPGDDVRAVHWRSSARRGSLVVKEFERVAPDANLVLVDLSHAEPQRVEQAIVLAASLVAELARAPEPLALAVAGRRLRLMAPTAGSAALQRGLDLLALARSAPPDRAPDLERVLKRAQSLSPLSRVVGVTTADGVRRVAGRTLWSAGELERYLLPSQAPGGGAATGPATQSLPREPESEQGPKPASAAS